MIDSELERQLREAEQMSDTLTDRYGNVVCIPEPTKVGQGPFRVTYQIFANRGSLAVSGSFDTVAEAWADARKRLAPTPATGSASVEFDHCRHCQDEIRRYTRQIAGDSEWGPWIHQSYTGIRDMGIACKGGATKAEPSTLVAPQAEPAQPDPKDARIAELIRASRKLCQDTTFIGKLKHFGGLGWDHAQDFYDAVAALQERR